MERRGGDEREPPPLGEGFPDPPSPLLPTHPPPPAPTRPAWDPFDLRRPGSLSRPRECTDIILAHEGGGEATHTPLPGMASPLQSRVVSRSQSLPGIYGGEGGGGVVGWGGGVGGAPPLYLHPNTPWKLVAIPWEVMRGGAGIKMFRLPVQSKLSCDHGP